MKSILIVSVMTLLMNSSAFAIHLICESPQKDFSGKSLTVYKFSSQDQIMEKWIYYPEKNGYLYFDRLDHLSFTDDLRNLSPLRRTVSASQGNKEILYAYWDNGNTFFHARISGEGSDFSFRCKWKE